VSVPAELERALRVRGGARFERIGELARRLFGDAREVLAVGLQVELEQRSVSLVAAPAQAALLGQHFAAALWLVRDALRPGLALLRPLLLPDAPLLLVAPAHAPALARLRALLAREPAPAPASREVLCEGLLLHGFCAPGIPVQLPGWLVAAGRLPKNRSELDAFFEQPAARTNR
jgi:hypothetical protein